VGVLPGSLAFSLQKLEPYGMWLVIGLLVIVPLVTQRLGHEINLYATLIQPIVSAIYSGIMVLFGIGLAS
jgi:hypothetical protein